MPELKAKEIFAVGKWNGIEFSEEDLDDIVANFEKLAEIHKVPLKFGHNDEQKITDGQPAIGWVQRVYRQGKKLLADFADVPNVVFEAIKKKLYRTVSVELLFNVDHSGTKFGHVLDAVALLGADQPAVNTLDDLNKLLATRAEFSGGHREYFRVEDSNKVNITQPEEPVMDKAELKALIDEALSPLKEELKATKDQLKAAEDKALKLERDAASKADEEKRESIKARRQEIVDILDEAVRDGKTTPAFKETYARQIGLNDDARVMDIDVKAVSEMFGVELKKKKEFGRETARNIDDPYADITDPTEKLDRMTRDFQVKHNVEKYSVAFSRVSKAHPELLREHLDAPGEK